MLLGKLRRGYAPQAAVRPDLVVVLAPNRGSPSCFVQRLKPVLIEVLVTELAVKALDIAVLHGPAGLDQDVVHTVCMCPSQKLATGELWAVVNA